MNESDLLTPWCFEMCERKKEGVVEGHSDNTKVEVFKAANRLMPMVSFWEHGKDSGSGGLGLLIQETFFKRFQYFSWDVISPLQCGRLTMIGREGWLDIYVVYADSRGFEHRKPLYNNLKTKMRPQHQTTSYMMGDWNFATCHYDRIFNPSYQHTGDNDKEEAKHFLNLLAKPCGFRELQQEEYTFHGVRRDGTRVLIAFIPIPTSPMCKTKTSHALEQITSRAYLTTPQLLSLLPPNTSVITLILSPIGSANIQIGINYARPSA